MNSTKSLKRALISSILVLALCFTMLLGTTFAWFTDSAASSGNVIQSGTLNIDLLVKGGNTGYTDYTSVKNSSAPVFNYDKWEPGYTVWANAKVTTTGNLAVKYTMKITADGTPSILADVIDVYYAPSEVAQPATRDLSGLTRIGTLSEVLAGTVVINDYLIPGTNEADFATLALHMQETAGNEYQDKTIGSTFSIMILATQYTYEEDSFDELYDENAEFNPGLAYATVTSGGANFTVNEAPVSAKQTNVAITDLDNVSAGDTMTLDVDVIDLADAISSFTVESGHTAVAGIDLTLKDSSGQKVTFDNGVATITTYIIPGLDPANLSVKYTGEGAQPTDVTYDSTSGKLTFKTTHFSSFFADYNGEWYLYNGRAYLGEILNVMAGIAEEKTENIDKLDLEGIRAARSANDPRWAVALFMLKDGQFRPTSITNTEREYKGTCTDEELLAIMQAYYDNYKDVTENRPTFPDGTDLGGMAPWPVVGAPINPPPFFD